MVAVARAKESEEVGEGRKQEEEEGPAARVVVVEDVVVKAAEQ